MAAGGGRILSNVVRAQWEEHRRYGGVVPEIAARAHVECLDEIIGAGHARGRRRDFRTWRRWPSRRGPGLIGGLLVGVATAKAIALVHDLILVAVNHLEAHALTVGLTEGLRPPYLLLLVSGGHTQLLIVHGVGRYERLGTTIDDALGEAFDKTAKLLGLGFPGGPAVEKAAAAGKAGRFLLPRPMLGRSEPHFSFAGLKTAVRHQAQALAPLTGRRHRRSLRRVRAGGGRQRLGPRAARDGDCRRARCRKARGISSWPAVLRPTRRCGPR